jgi:hypothetical protein
MKRRRSRSMLMVKTVLMTTVVRRMLTLATSMPRRSLPSEQL